MPVIRARRPLVATAALVTAIAAGGLTLSSASSAGAASLTSGGWTTAATAAPASAARGATLTLKVTVKATTTRTALVDLEVYSGTGSAYQRFWDNQSFTAGTTRTFSTTWTLPAMEPAGTHRVKVGVFAPGWASMLHWNDGAATFTVTTGSTVTTVPATTVPATTVPKTTTTVTGSHFVTLPPGSALPSDAACAARVRPVAEVRPVNAVANHAPGQVTAANPSALFTRVDGAFSGTTDEILQWVACKWGIDEDLVRAQAAKESWWTQSAAGDYGTDPTRCAPGHTLGSDGVAGQCPESVGLLQVRFPYWGSGFPAAGTSTAYNADYAYAAWRMCFEGQDGWLNTVERGATYAAGDAMGCVGTWFAGRWRTAPALTYMAAVQSYLDQRIWTTPGFKS